MISDFSDSPLPTIRAGNIHFRLEGNLAAFHADLACEEIEPQLHLIHINLAADTPVTPTPVKLTWRYPIVDIMAMWSSGCDSKRWLSRPWEITVQSQATKDAPVISLYNLAGDNRLTFACSDAVNHIESTASIDEATSTFSCHLHFFAHPTAPLSQYRATLRVDQRACRYHQSIRDVEAWWTSQPDSTPSFVPDVARLPMYSTWYSFHKELSDTEVEKQCLLAKDFGCDAVIIDDGWQTEDNNDGYAYCGDWEVCQKKFPDMSAHIARLHQIGMASILWFSVPFIGFKSRAYSRFKGKYLYEIESLNAFNMSAAVLDPRYPEVREYLISLYEKAIRDWDLDGLKLDFVDQFTPTEANYKDDPAGRDIDSVPIAVDRLLRDTMTRLSRIKPNILIEFRQAYIGPLMRNYGNLFRAGDCPNDAICNRVRTIDVRLLAGSTATHSDMLMWSPDEPVESAARQFLNVLFSVPQISLRLDKIPESHQRMLRFWLKFWRSHRDVLLDGELEPYYPELQYPFIVAKNDRKWIGALYADMVAPLSGKLPGEIYVINATHQPRIILDVDTDSGVYDIEERTVLGETIDKRRQTLSAGIHPLKVSPSGLLHLKIKSKSSLDQLPPH
jgi:alpha-galactosidase